MNTVGGAGGGGRASTAPAPTERSSRRLTGRVAVVTGATGGIGQAIVAALHEEGASIVLTGRSRRPPNAPGDAEYVTADVSQEADVIAVIAAAMDRYGRVDILINAHGVDFHSDLETTEVLDVERVFRINLIGSFLTIKHAVPAMRSGGSGAIVNIASRLGLVAIPGQAIYSASKGALIMLTRGAAIDLAPHSIRVNCVAPGVTKTPMISKWVDSQPDAAAFEAAITGSIPLRRMATGLEIARVVAFLCSDDSSYMTGAIVTVDGGYTAT